MKQELEARGTVIDLNPRIPDFSFSLCLSNLSILFNLNWVQNIISLRRETKRIMTQDSNQEISSQL